MSSEKSSNLSNEDHLFPKQFETNNGYKITIITIVLLTIFLLFLGINIFYIIINLIILTGEFFIKSLGVLGYVSGNAINETTDTVANATNAGVNITSDVIQTAGNLVKSVSKPLVDNETIAIIDKSTSNINKITPTTVKPTEQFMEKQSFSTFPTGESSTNSIVPSNKKESFSLLNMNFEPNLDIFGLQKKDGETTEQWCLIGSSNGINSCISVNDYDKCMSSQLFPSQKECMNPVLMA